MAAQVEVPPIVIAGEFELGNSRIQPLESMLSLRTPDDLPHLRHQDIHRGDRSIVIVLKHVERFDVAGIVRHDDRNTEVILGQVRLFKRAGVDADCGCADGSNWTPYTGFAEVQTTQVAPGECVIWQLRATNEGAATAYNVTITDEVTPFTTLENTDNACVDSVDGNNCVPSAGATANSGVAPVVEWTVGDLLSGDTARTRFCVSVD